MIGAIIAVVLTVLIIGLVIGAWIAVIALLGMAPLFGILVVTGSTITQATDFVTSWFGILLSFGIGLFILMFTGLTKSMRKTTTIIYKQINKGGN